MEQPFSTEASVGSPGSIQSRRSFLTKALAVLFGTLAGVVPVFAGLFTVFDPLRRRGKVSEFLPITRLDALPEGGAWRQFPVIAQLQDAWTKTAGARIGAVYLKRTGPGEVAALSTICPHAGCFVGPIPDGSFKCPCHDSEFESDGKRREKNSQGLATVSPRGLDSLEVKIEDGKVLVKYERFRTGSAEKIPQG